MLNSAIVPEVRNALAAWVKAKGAGILIGGLALSFYIKPRYTEDVDLLFMTDTEVPDEVPGCDPDFRNQSGRYRKLNSIETACW